MWIKNLQLFLLNAKWNHSATALEEKLAEMPCRDCGPQELRTEGFVPPLKASDRLVFAAEGLQLLCYQEITRLLPAAVIRELLDEKVEDIEAKENRKMGRKEKADLKEQVVFEALPRAFSRSRRTYCVIDTQTGRVMVDASSRKLAEQVTEALRKAVGSLPIAPPVSNVSVSSVMTEWLQAPKHWPPMVTLGDRGELRDGNDDGPVVRVTGMDLLGDEVKTHLNAGMELAKVNLCWRDLLEFDLAEDLSVKRLRPLDQLKEQMDEQDAEDPEAEMMASLALQGGNIRQLLDVLFPVLSVEAPKPI